MHEKVWNGMEESERGGWLSLLTDWMLAGIGREYLLEVWTAYGQDDFVRLQQLSIAGQRYVH